MKIRIIVFLSVILILIVGGYLWFTEATSPVSSDNTTPIIFVVKPGESIRSIAERLENNGIIRSSIAFFILVKKNQAGTEIQAGDFRLNSSMSASEVIQELKHGTIDVWVTIPEGWRSEEIALLLAKELAVPEQEFLKLSKEGYMFPDTYLIPQQASASIAAQLMLDNFNEKVIKKFNSQIKASSLSLDEIVTLASLVERETNNDKDRPIVAGILFNRLKDDMLLNIDATVQYIVGYQPDEKDWWKEELTEDDLAIDSPYNTYIYKGIPPGPIANPGISSIIAVLNPADTPYYYYISDSNGVNHYAVTLEEHNANVERYLR